MKNESITQEQFYELKEFVEAKFDKVDAQFDKVDAQFDKVDAQFDKVDAKFDSVEAKFDKLEDSMNKLRTWTVSAFFGAVVVIGTLMGTYAMFLMRLPQ